MGQARPAGVCSFIQRLNYHNKTIDRPSLSRARTLSTVCEERVRRSVAILMTALCGGGGTTGAAGSYIAGVTLLTRRPSGRSMRYPLRQSIHYRARMQACSSSTTTDGRTDLWHRAALALLCLHACIARAAPVRRQRCRPARIRRRSPSWCIGAGAGRGRCRSTSTDGCSHPHPMQTPPRQAPLARVRALSVWRWHARSHRTL